MQCPARNSRLRPAKAPPVTAGCGPPNMHPQQSTAARRSPARMPPCTMPSLVVRWLCKNKGMHLAIGLGGRNRGMPHLHTCRWFEPGCATLACERMQPWHATTSHVSLVQPRHATLARARTQSWRATHVADASLACHTWTLMTACDVWPQAVRGCGFRVFSAALDDGGTVRCCRVPDGSAISNSRLKPKGDVAAEAVAAGAAGLAFIRVGDGGTIDAAKPIKEGLNEAQAAAVVAAAGAKPGDLLLIAAGPKPTVLAALDRVRQYVAKSVYGLAAPGQHSLLWVVDFPMFEYDAEERRYVAVHHPFTAPSDDALASGDFKHAKVLWGGGVWLQARKGVVGGRSVASSTQRCDGVAEQDVPMHACRGVVCFFARAQQPASLPVHSAVPFTLL
eukprot:365942-Chlamydomonas_euryale.AAC.74